MSNTTPGRILAQNKDVPGLLECTMKHTVTDVNASFKWTGPKISAAEWHKVLAFFRWTNNEHQSESQVRLFVNNRTGEWRAWAFPQKARTGMSAQELEVPEAAEQRRQFLDSEGWTYFGTVHHHCGMGAFQSGTDTDNEKNQDGLHITVGHMNSETYSLHHRFYLAGVDMSRLVKMDMFWDIGNVLDLLPGYLKDMVKSNLDLLACTQMCVPPPVDTEFPQIWKDNVKEEVRPTVFHGGGGVTSIGGSPGSSVHWSDPAYTGPGSGQLQRRFWRNRAGKVAYESDKVKAIRFLKMYLASLPEGPQKPTMMECCQYLGELFNMIDDDLAELLDIMFVCDLTPDTFMDAVDEYEQQQQKIAAINKQIEEEAQVGTTNKKAGKRGKRIIVNTNGASPAEVRSAIEQAEQRMLGEGYPYNNDY